MPESKCMSVEQFTNHPEVLNCIKRLEDQFGKGGKNLVVSDVLDDEEHQYVNLVQKGGGVLGMALVGYTYILEQMGIRFVRLAGTSAGAINTALMAVAGSDKMDGEQVKGSKKMAKSKAILQTICELDFFKLVDGHPAARWLIKSFISSKDFGTRAETWLKAIAGLLILLPLLALVCLGLQHRFADVAYATITLFVLTGFFYMLVAVLGVYAIFLLNRLKESGFGINPGDYFYDWLKVQFARHHVHTVSDLVAVAQTPVEGLHLRVPNKAGITGLDGDVTFIASELVTQNKIEFPKMWNLFTSDIDTLKPAGFVRASMAIPMFFESYFINDIPCAHPAVKEAWLGLGENDPPSTARFVDGGILSNFPINLFYNPEVEVPRLPSFGIDLDDLKDPLTEFSTVTTKDAEKRRKDDESKNAMKWSFAGYLGRMFNTIRSYYDKDFLIKNQFYKRGIGTIPLKGFGWLNFFLTDADKLKMFVLGAKAATKFLQDFRWQEYKNQRMEMQRELDKTKVRQGTNNT